MPDIDPDSITPAATRPASTSTVGAVREGHEHAWITESRHPTSEGAVVYTRCARCPARRVEIDDAAGLPPTAVSRTVGDPCI